MGKVAGVSERTAVRVTVKPGRIVIETDKEQSLDEILAASIPSRPAGEVMPFAPVDTEVIRQWRERGARPHPWGARHNRVLEAALKKLHAICGISADLTCSQQKLAEAKKGKLYLALFGRTSALHDVSSKH